MKRIIASTLFGLVLSTGVYAEEKQEDVNAALKKYILALQLQTLKLNEKIEQLQANLEDLESKTIDALRIGDETHKGLLKNTTLNRMRIEVLERTRGPKSNPRMIGPNRFNQEM